MNDATAESKVTSCLESIRELTRLCQESITAGDPQVLLDNLQERQQIMNQADALRTSESSRSERQHRILAEIIELDQAAQTAARNLLDLYRCDLQGIRNQRRIRTYNQMPGHAGHYLDTCE